MSLNRARKGGRTGVSPPSANGKAPTQDPKSLKSAVSPRRGAHSELAPIAQEMTDRVSAPAAHARTAARRAAA